MTDAVRRQPSKPGPRGSLSAPSGSPRTTSITRASSRPSPPKTKVLLVRQPVKSVRPATGYERAPLRLAIGVVATVGALAAIWLIGHLGYQLGFATLMEVPQLGDDPAGGLSTGTLMLLATPFLVLQAGLDRPEWLMLAFGLIAIPGAALGAARPRTPGSPRLPTVIQTIAALGAAVAGLNSVALVWWNACPFRHAMLQPLPLQPSRIEAWGHGLQIVAGLDVLAFIIAVLWVILVMRLPIPTWLRVLGGTITLFAAAITLVGMSISTATATLIRVDRSVCLHEQDATLFGQLLLGSTPHRHALLRVEGDIALIELSSEPDRLTIIGSQSVLDYLAERAAENEPNR